MKFKLDKKKKKNSFSFLVVFNSVQVFAFIFILHEWNLIKDEMTHNDGALIFLSY